MNKIYKVMYSKVKQCCVVVSEIAKSHGHNGESSGVRKHAALTAAVLIALGSLSFTVVPIAPVAADFFRNDYVGTNYTKDNGKSYAASETKNYHGNGAKGVGSNTLGLNAIAGKNTVTIGDRDASLAQESVYIGSKYDANNQIHPSSGKSVVSVGYGSDAAGTGSIAIGSGASADAFDNAGTGANPDSDSHSIAIGNNAVAKQNNIAIGAGSEATAAASKDKAYLSGQDAVSSYVSVGKSDALRRISNVADGAADSDVATVGQLKKLSDRAGVYNEGWGIKIGDYTTKDANGQETTVKNAISIDRNLGSNEITSKSNNTFEAAGENSLILGGAGTDDFVAINGKHREKDYGSYGKDSVLVGGENNKTTKDGTYAVISGGGQNIASGKHSFIGGGWWNTATGATSTVVGGQANTASGNQSTVVGGQDSRAIGDESTILGGFQHTAVGENSTISGGAGAYTLGQYSSVSGGQGNIAIGMTSSADGGWLNFAYGDWSQASGGYSNYVLGNASNSLGGRDSVIQGNLSVGIAGGSTGQGAGYALAAGYQSVVTAEGVHREKSSDSIVDSYLEAGNDTGGNEGYKYTDVATALGYQATANETNTVSFGHDKGDVSGYTVNWDIKYDTDDQGNIKFNEDGMPLVESIKANGITTNHYDSAKYNRLVKVADGINNHDVVVMEQLRNADNVGKNAKNNVVVYKENKDGTLQVDENGEAIIDVEASKAATEKATEQAIKDSEDAWGSAIGTGKVEANNSQLVTGDTVYNAIQNQAEWKLTTNDESADKTVAIKPGTTVNFSAEKNGKDHRNVTISHNGSNVTIGLDKDIVLGEATNGNGGSLNVYSDSTEASNLGNRVSIDGSTVSVNYGKEDGTSGTKRGVVLGVGEDYNNNAQGYIAFNNIDAKGTIGSTYLHSATDAPNDLKGRLVYSNAIDGTEYIANLDDGITFTGDVQKDVPKDYTQTPTKLNTTLNITGGAATEKDLTEGNIGVVSTPAVESADGTTQASKLEIKLNKDLKGITSISSQPTSATTTTGAKIELGTNGTTISGGDVNVSKNKITNLKNGEADTDAATVGQMKTAIGDAKTKYYSVQEGPQIGGFSTNENNDGASASTLAGLAAGYETGTTGIFSTVVGSYSGVIGSWLQGAAAVSVGTVNVNNNTGTSKAFSGVANSIVGQANMTTDSNAAIIVGAGNNVTNSYRDLDPEDALSKITSAVASKDANALKEALQDAVPKSGGQVMVMGGGNNVESAYMSQVVGVGNTVKGNQVYTKDAKTGKWNWTTDTNEKTAIKDYDPKKSSQYNYVDGFNNEVINGKHDYIIGANNKLDGDSYDDNNAKPIKRSNKSNVVIGDNHALTGKKNNVIIGSADTEGTLTRASDAVIIGHNANATSDTGADNAVAIGLSAKAGGGNAVTIGVNTSAGENSITIGSESHAISGSNIAIGRSAQVYGYEITNAVALGQEANAKVADGVAIGSGSEATVTGKSTEGYDPTTGQTSTDTTGTWQATKAAVSIGKADGTVTRQINGVAAGTNDTDAVNVAQLKKLEGMKANVDASNIGKNLKGADGKTAAADAEKTTNENAWGEALGTGTVTKDSKQLVTGSTVYNEVRPSKDGKYVKMSQTTGENLLNLDSQVQTNTDKLSDVDSRSVKYDTKTVNDKTVVDNTKITLAGEGGTTITNLKDGVNANDAATMGQLNDRISGVTYKAGDGIKYGTDADNNKTISVNKGDGLKFTEDHKLAVNTGKHLSVNTDGQIDVGDNGTVAENDGNLVTGDTVYKALNGGMTKMIIGTPGKNGKDGTPGTIGLVGPAGADGKNAEVDITIQQGKDEESKGVKGANGVDGQDGITRIVYKDAAGDHQVATMEDGLKFAGDDGQKDANKVIAKKLNNIVDIIGGAKGDLTEGNIGVNNDSGKLKIQLAQELTGITSISGSTGSNGAKITLDTNDQNISVNGGKITDVASGLSTNDGSYNAKDANNAANISDVNSMISKAVTDAKGETQQNLDKKANVDASNIGTKLKGADGKTAATEDEQKANLDKWGEAIGTGEVKDGSKQLVTGNTVYNAVKDKADKSYVDTQLNTKANTDGSNIDADKFSKKVAIGNINDSDERAVSGKTVNEAIQTINGNIDGKANKNLDNIDNAGKNVIKDQARAAVTIDNKGLNTNVVATQDDKNHTTTYTINVEGNGKVAAKDTGLISGDTIYKELRPATDGNYIKTTNTTAQNLTSLDTQVRATHDLINSDGKTIKIGGSDAATKIDVNGKDGKGRVITGVVSDANDPNSAANVGYVNGLTAANTQQIYRDMNNAYGRLNNNINKAAAGSNALAALHPLDYDPDDKADFAVGYGHYRNANAAAVGAFYHPNENTMVNVGVSLGNGDPGFNAGVSFKVGRGGAGREAMSKTEMAKVINSQSKEIDALKKDNADKDKRIDALEQKMAEILAKLDKNGK